MCSSYSTCNDCIQASYCEWCFRCVFKGDCFRRTGRSGEKVCSIKLKVRPAEVSTREIQKVRIEFELLSLHYLDCFITLISDDGMSSTTTKLTSFIETSPRKVWKLGDSSIQAIEKRIKGNYIRFIAEIK
ncbi:uncharacterized protein LOC128554282 [Mercenaria mercenaria]|uniref:uncharacterized protein LOC128554282 n=1 Tax=Mercenaria mercenaria TaxID=6596 RepID=UPI00234FA9C0|nr:uncharacterized protein LOC128554282 [Mercenaria mercenaria]